MIILIHIINQNKINIKLNKLNKIKYYVIIISFHKIDFLI